MHDETEAGKPLGEMDAATGPNKSLGVSGKSAAAGARWAAPESSVAAHASRSLARLQRDRASSMLKFVSFGCKGATHGVTPETNRAALEAYNGRKPHLLALMNDTKPQGMLSGAPSKSPSGSPECVG